MIVKRSHPPDSIEYPCKKHPQSGAGPVLPSPPSQEYHRIYDSFVVQSTATQYSTDFTVRNDIDSKHSNLTRLLTNDFQKDMMFHSRQLLPSTPVETKVPASVMPSPQVSERFTLLRPTKPLTALLAKESEGLPCSSSSLKPHLRIGTYF